MKKEDNPGVSLPPPLIYGLFFGCSLIVQKLVPINKDFFNTSASTAIGIFLLAVCLAFDLPSLIQFFRTKNTIITIKSTNSLQTKGLYSISRNPMYTGLLCLYTSLAMFVGNWWTILLMPFVIFIIQSYVIRREESYLTRHFGQQFIEYTKHVRRWL
jgi:protein-S-isoprenylcysteine O-methyltransferase Ste14